MWTCCNCGRFIRGVRTALNRDPFGLRRLDEATTSVACDCSSDNDELGPRRRRPSSLRTRSSEAQVLKDQKL